MDYKQLIIELLDKASADQLRRLTLYQDVFGAGLMFSPLFLFRLLQVPWLSFLKIPIRYRINS